MRHIGALGRRGAGAGPSRYAALARRVESRHSPQLSRVAPSPGALAARQFSSAGTAVDAGVFPTTEDVALYITHEKYRWQPRDPSDDAGIVQSAQRLILDGESPGMDGSPTKPEILHYMMAGRWREAELFDALRPSPAQLDTLLQALDLDKETARAVMQQLRHTDANPLGAANAWAPDEGGKEFDSGAVEAHLAKLSSTDFARWFPSSTPGEIRRLRNGLQTGEFSDDDKKAIAAVTKVLALTKALSVAFPFDFGKPGAVLIPTEEVTSKLEGLDPSIAQQWAAAVEAAPDREAWAYDDIMSALAADGHCAPGDAAAEAGAEEEDEDEEDDEEEEEEYEDEDDEDASPAPAVDSSVVSGAAVLNMDREEYARRLRASVQDGDRGDMLLALDMLGMSASSFRSWLKTGVLPQEWGGPNLSPATDQIALDKIKADAALIQKSERLVVTLRRTAKKAQMEPATSSSWRSSLSESSAVDARTAKLAAALEWVADAVDAHLESICSDDRESTVMHRNPPGCGAAHSQVQQLLEQSDDYSGTGDHWPYVDGVGDAGGKTALDEVLKTGIAVAKSLAPGAMGAGETLRQVQAQLKQIRQGEDRMAKETVKSEAYHKDLGERLSRQQAASGEALAGYAARCRAEYFAKLESGEIGSFEDLDGWLATTRLDYWQAAGVEWQGAVTRPHLWRAAIEELGHQAVETYWQGFVVAKAKDVHAENAGRGRGRGRGKDSMADAHGRVFSGISMKNVEKLRQSGPQWASLLEHAEDAQVDWVFQRSGMPESFSKGKRGDLFSPADSLRSLHPDGDERVDEPYVTWATKEYMWSLHQASSDRWTASELSRQFGIKLSNVEATLEMFEVAPAVAAHYEIGTERKATKVARELQQHWLDVEEANLHRKGDVINITTAVELKEASKGRAKGIVMADLTQVEMAEQNTYYDQAGPLTGSRTEQAEGGGDGGGSAAVDSVSEQTRSKTSRRMVIVGTSQQKTRHRRAAGTKKLTK